MNDSSIQRICELSSHIFEFLQLEEKVQQTAFPLLSEGIQSTIEILKLIENRELTYEEIAEKVGLHHNTVRQKLLALCDGDYPGLDLSETTAIAATGRPRTLVKKEENL
jgi:response regulator of citrate/malate metabolism